MSAVTPPSPEKASIVLLRKVIILILLVVGAAIIMTILFTYDRIPSGFWTLAFLSTGMGLAAGLSSRWVLGRNPLFVRIICGLLFVVAGLELLGLFTNWQAGLDPLTVGRKFTSWKNFGQLAWGAGITLLVLLAWPAAKAHSSNQQHQHLSTSRPKRTHWPRGKGQANFKSSKKQLSSKASVKKPASVSRRTISRRKPALRLSARVENRCPYCLEEIKPNDPRGTVECKVCHTLHHADCWAVTGVCQVPHFTA
jgi:hypothetical protein